ncbi:hypothetical protein CRG98_028345 [Punica granatum]|uniref:Retrotransposon gag domain-containing protein n=1 Tax=Punica granatum TaxID=22663 RepID=A0A2I0J5D2_PUNGR|nr:hypothetical protein CRG98_028345 [Punica granatum]
MTYVPTVSSVSDPMPPPPAPTSVPFPSAAFLSTDLAMLTLPPLTTPTQPPIYTVPPPTVPPVAITQIPAPTAEPFSFQAPQTQMSFSYQTPPPLNIPPTKPGTLTHAAPAVLLTNIPPGNEHEKRMKRMEETIRALQAGTSHPDFGDSDWNLFPGMLLPPKIKIPDFKRYDGTKDPRHHLRHYHSKMLSYWDYEEFVIQTFQDSLTGPALDWFMTLKAGPSRKKDGETPKKQTAGTSRRLLASSILDIRLHSRFRWTTPLHYRLLRHMRIPCIMCNLIKRRKLISQPRQLLSSRNLRNSTLLFKFNKLDPRFRDLLSRLNVFQLLELNKTVLLNRVHAGNTPIYQPPSHIFRQLLVGNRIKTEAPDPHFDPSIQNQNLPSLLCAPEFNLVGARMRAPKQTRLGRVHLPGEARRTHVRRSRHLPFYDPGVEGRQVTRV